MPNDLRESARFTGEEHQLANAWGWSGAPKEVLELAQLAIKFRDLRTGDILVSQGILSRETVDELLASKPSGVPTLEYFSAAEGSRVKSHADRILALKEQIAFYGNLGIMQRSERMLQQTIHSRCEKLDAVLMATDAGREVLVFAHYSKLKTYSRAGREEIATDPIWTKDLLFAVGSRDDISTILTSTKAGALTGAGEFMDLGGTYLAGDGSDNDAIRELTRILDHGLNMGATDLSVKPADNNGNYRVRLRRYGRLVDPFKRPTIWPADLANQILQFLAVKSGANPKLETLRIPTDGNWKYRSSAGTSNFRLSFIPLNKRGDLKNLRSLAMRFFRDSEKMTVRFDDLRVPENVRTHIRDALRSNSGMIVVMGPVGSGKSSLLAAMIGEHVEMFGDTQERLSLEHPVERELNGIAQFEPPIGVQSPNGVVSEEEAWHYCLRAFKRHDLDVAMVGEMRDRFSAEFCVGVGAMGQLVLGTFHAKDTITGYDVVRQMISEDMRFQAAEAYTLAVGVRLVNGVCQACCEKGADGAGVPPLEEERRRFKFALDKYGEELSLPDLVYRANPNGCEKCDSGYGDYVQVFEVLPFTRKVKDAAISMLSAADRRAHRAEMAAGRELTLLQSALTLLVEKKIDVETLTSI